MFFFQHRRPSYSPTPVFGSSLLTFGLFCLLFGLAILAAPELLAYLVAGFLILIGVTLLSLWWKLRR